MSEFIFYTFEGYTISPPTTNSVLNRTLTHNSILKIKMHLI